MGVKSTRHLTRQAAEEKYVDLRQEETRRAIRAQAVAMNDTELEDMLERLNDTAHGGEGFENYIISEHPER
jgi:archaellum biogenesis protein FlaJ (TadC family)